MLLTSQTYGWFLWRDEVLPVTVALGQHLGATGGPLAAVSDWACELLDWVGEAEADAVT